MLKVSVLATLLVSSVYANSYGYGSYGPSGDLSGGISESLDGGLGGYSGGLDGGLGGFAGSPQIISGHGGLGSLPVVRKQHIDFVRVPQQQLAPIAPAQLLVDSQMNPISLVYRSHGAPINILQKHIPSRGTFKQSQTEEEPSRHLHTIHKPVIQEIREIITPYRKVIQSIMPVQEDIQTIVAKATPVAPAPGGSGFGGSGFGGSGFGGSGLGGMGHGSSGQGSSGRGGSGHESSGHSYRTRSGRAVGRVVSGPSIGVAAGEYGGLVTAAGAY